MLTKQIVIVDLFVHSSGPFHAYILVDLFVHSSGPFHAYILVDLFVHSSGPFHTLQPNAWAYQRAAPSSKSNTE